MKLHHGLVAGLVLSVSVFAAIEPLWAKPDGSQRLRGLGDRVFLVTAELTEDLVGIGLPIGTTFPNCYIFAEEPNGEGYNWFESAFPDAKGIWAQQSNGAKTRFAMQAINGPDVVRQWGQVTPGHGKGNLQITVVSTVDFFGGGDPNELEFYSIGEEIDASEAESMCPTELIPTFPE